jgi:small GTP-binding protein
MLTFNSGSIGNFFREHWKNGMSSQRAGRDPDFTVKIVMVGDSGVGKSSLVLRWIANSFDPNSISTVGFATSQKLVISGDKLVEVTLWDTAGTDRFRSVSPAYYRSADGGILVYDISSAQSFTNLDRWLSDLREYASPNSVGILVGNKSDLHELRAVGEDEGLDFGKTHNLSFMETSAKEAICVTEAFDLLLATIVDNLGSRSLGQGGAARHIPAGMSIQSVELEPPAEPPAQPESCC